MTINSGDLQAASLLVTNTGGSLGEPNYAAAMFSNPESAINSAYIDNYDATRIKLYRVTGTNQLLTAPLTQTISGGFYMGNKGTL